MQINHADEFIKNARKYERYPKQRYFAEESDYTEVWYETIHRHLEENILPKIKKGGELFIDYWPAWFVVDRQHTLRQGTATGALYNYEYGSHGTGYICITSQHLYIIFMRSLTEQFPLTKPSMRRFILGALSRRVNRLRPFQSDYTWMLSPADIQTISMSSTHEAERIKMVTSLGTWEVYEHFIDQHKDIFGAIESLRRGEFSKLKPKWHDTKRPRLLSEAELMKHQKKADPRLLTLSVAPDKARYERGLRMLNLPYLAAETSRRGGADVELDLINAVAAYPDNSELRELRQAFATMRHLLDRCSDEADVLDNLHIRIERIPHLAEAYRLSVAQLTRPYIRTRHPFPDRPHPALVRTIEINKLHNNGHDGEVRLSWGPGKSAFITGGRDGVVRIWDLPTGSVKEQFQAFDSQLGKPPHSWLSELGGCALSPDEQTLLAFHGEQGIRAWDMRDWRPLFQLDERHIVYAAFDSSGERIAYCTHGRNKSVRVLDSRTGYPLAHNVSLEKLRLEGHGDLLRLRLGPSGDWVLLWIHDNGNIGSRLVGVDLASGEEMFAFGAPDVNSLEISPRGDYILIGWAFNAYELHVWNIATGDWGPAIKRPNNSIGPWALSPSGRHIVSGFDDGRVIVYSMDSGSELYTLFGHQVDIKAVCFSSDEQFILSLDRNHTVKLWDLAKATLPFDTPKYFLRDDYRNDARHAWSCETCDVNPLDETTIVLNASTFEWTAAILDGSSGCISKLHAELLKNRSGKLHEAKLSQIQYLIRISSCAIGGNGKYILLVNDKEWAVFDTQDLEPYYSGEIEYSNTTSQVPNVCAFSPDGRWIAVALKNELMIRNLTTGEVSNLTPEGTIQSCVFAPDSTWIVWASDTLVPSGRVKEFKMLNLDTGFVRSFDNPMVKTEWGTELRALDIWGPVLDCAVVPDGSRVLAMHYNGVLSVWDAVQLTLIHSWQASTYDYPPHMACASMPDNRTALTVSHERAIRLWEIDTGICLFSIFVDSKLEDCKIFPSKGGIVVVGESGIYWLDIKIM